MKDEQTDRMTEREI